jgi:actin-related protein 8
LTRLITKIHTNRQVAADTKDAEAKEAAAKLAPQESTETPSEEEENELSGSKVIVIHPGSRNLRIGLASQAFPQMVPMVIVRPPLKQFPSSSPLPVRLRKDPEASDPLFGEKFDESVVKLDTILKARLKAAKKRTVPNARELVASYNRRSQYEELADFNDPEQIEWIDLKPDMKYCVGNDVVSFVYFAYKRH